MAAFFDYSILFLFAATLVAAKFKDVSDRPKCASFSSEGAKTPSDSKLSALRLRMRNQGLGAYIVPSVDQHGSEYIGNSDKRRQWLSGFTGSAGKALVTADKAILWTDGRYILQAENELDCLWGILEMTPGEVTWAAENLRNVKIGADPKLFTQSQWEDSAALLSADKNANLTLVPTPSLIDRIWTTPERPERPRGANVTIQPMKFAGVSWEEKATLLRARMKEVGADFLLVVDLMEVAWLFNLRGQADIPYNPVFYSFAILPKEKGSPIRLFVGKTRVSDDVKRHLSPDCAGRTFGYYVDEATTRGKETKNAHCPSGQVVVEEYDDFYAALEELVNGKDSKFWFSSYANFKIFQTIPKRRQIVKPPSPLRDLKAIKNPEESEGMKSAHVKDAIALIKFAAKLEKVVNGEDDAGPWNEVDVANRLKEFRAAEADSRGESFPTIAGYEANGAIIHYDPTKSSEPAVVGKGMLLLDSGGQYLDGTTDVTRTFHYGTPTEYQRESYTRVLMGQVDLAMAIFPEGVVTGNDLQTLARSPLWRKGMEYHHGTGHGIGSFLSVHEPPGLRGANMEAGMFFSDEPGYYVPKQFGIRLENICYTKIIDLPHDEEDQNFLAIDTITLVPYEPKLIDVSLLDNRQRRWINAYHARCDDKIGQELNKRGETEAYDWLIARTKPIPLLTRNSGAKTLTSFSMMANVLITAWYAIFL